MATGTVKNIKSGGYGFIVSDEGGKDLFFHVKDLARGTDEHQLAEGARVGFDARQGDRGLVACQVRILSADREPAVPDITVDEAIRGLKDALLVALQWVDALDAARKAEA
jgi:CspA family cold shock protein